MLAVTKEIEDPITGVEASYHIVDGYAINLKHKYMTINISSYFNKEKFSRGKQELSVRTLRVPWEDKITDLDFNIKEYLTEVLSSDDIDGELADLKGGVLE